MSIEIPSVPFFPEDPDDDDFLYGEEEDWDLEDDDENEGENEGEGENEEKKEKKEKKEKEMVWLDLFSFFGNHRVLFMFEEITWESIKPLIMFLTFHNLQDIKNNNNMEKPFHILINSKGGGVKPGLSLFDMMQHVIADVGTTGMGQIYSMATLILAGGRTEQRDVTATSRLLLHQPSSSFIKGRPNDIFVEANEIATLKLTIEELFEMRTKQPIEVVRSAIKRDKFMSAQEAVDFGLADFVSMNAEEKEDEKEDPLPKVKGVPNWVLRLAKRAGELPSLLEERGLDEYGNPLHPGDDDEDELSIWESTSQEPWVRDDRDKKDGKEKLDSEGEEEDISPEPEYTI